MQNYFGFYFFNGHFSFSSRIYTDYTFHLLILLSLKAASVSDLSPDSEELIYVVYTPRGPNEEPGQLTQNLLENEFKNQRIEISF
jgi:hypothetical protein